MAFRVQDQVSSLFWEVDDGHRVRLGEKGSVYTQNADGSITNVDTEMPLRLSGNKLVEGDWSVSWTIADGVISMDSEHIVQYDECSSSLRVASSPASWVIVPVGGSAPVAAPVPEPVPEPVTVPEPEPEPITVSESEPESDEDVPVARSAALIEEALNAQAAESEPDEEA